MILTVSGLSYGYHPGESILDNISLTIAAGEFVAITGVNGAGKSTLLKVIAGVNKPYTGSVKLMGKEISGMKPIERARIIAMVAQGGSITEPFIALDVVLMGRKPYQKGIFWNRDDIDTAIRCMEKTGVAQMADSPITELSGGQAQRVMIARALAQEAKLLLLDEPTISLDTVYREEIMQILAGLNKENGITILMVSHDPEAVSGYCSREVILSNGRVVNK